MDKIITIMALAPITSLLMLGSRAFRKPVTKYLTISSCVVGSLSGLIGRFSLTNFSLILGYLAYVLLLLGIVLLPDKTLKFHGEQVINFFFRMLGLFFIISSMIFLIYDYSLISDAYLMLLPSFCMIDVVFYYQKPNDTKNISTL